MIIKLLLGIGLILTPFMVLPGVDVRDIKLTIASVMAIALCSTGLYHGETKRIDNKWFYIFMFYSLTCFIVTPAQLFNLLGTTLVNFWIWQPMYHYLLFGLTIIIIANAKFSKRELNILFEIMIWCGFLMGIYVILQYFNIDQVFNNIGADRLGKIGGWVGNHTHVSPFIAMLIPLALYKKHRTMAIVMIIGVCVTTSQVAIGAMVIGLLLYFGFKHKNIMWGLIVIGALCIVAFSFIINTDILPPEKARAIFSDNQRLTVYRQVIQDVNAPPFRDSESTYPLTGQGMGQFKYSFHLIHFDDGTMKKFIQAHNDYLELLYNTGILGFALFIAMMFVFFKQRLKRFYYKGFSNIERALLSGLIIVCITAAGTFIFQIGTTIFYTVIFVGLLHNSTVIDTERNYNIGISFSKFRIFKEHIHLLFKIIIKGIYFIKQENKHGYNRSYNI